MEAVFISCSSEYMQRGDDEMSAIGNHGLPSRCDDRGRFRLRKYRWPVYGVSHAQSFPFDDFRVDIPRLADHHLAAGLLPRLAIGDVRCGGVDPARTRLMNASQVDD